jgi:hypothetical protein
VGRARDRFSTTRIQILRPDDERIGHGHEREQVEGVAPPQTTPGPFQVIEDPHDDQAGSLRARGRQAKALGERHGPVAAPVDQHQARPDVAGDALGRERLEQPTELGRRRRQQGRGPGPVALA